jgi:hypothetical protein
MAPVTRQQHPESLDVDRVARLARRHEQAVALASAETPYRPIKREAPRTCAGHRKRQPAAARRTPSSDEEDRGYVSIGRGSNHEAVALGARHDSLVCWQADTARANQAGIGRLEAPECSARCSLEVDLLIVGPTKSEVGR